MNTCLKIAFIVNEFPCISETFILNQITGLLELGHDIRIFAYRAASNSKQHAAISKWDLLNKTRYFAPIPQGRWRRLWKLLRILMRHSLRQPIKIRRCLDFGKYGLYASLNRLFLLEPLLDENYDVVHCQYGTLGKSWVYLKDIMDVKVVTSFRGYDLTKFIQENHPGIYAELFKKGDMFLPVCDYFAKRLQELGCPSDCIHVHYSAIDLSEFPFLEQKTNNGEIKFLTVARLVEKKGLEYSIKAVARIVRHCPTVQYTIAGDGPLRSRLVNLIQELGVEGYIHLAGRLLSDDISELMNKAHIFILASVTAQDGDQEGMPVSLMEAMATGLPVISTRHSGIPELVQDEVSGFLIPEWDVDALTAKCEYLISHPQRRTEMGNAGRRLVQENFDIRKLNQKLINIYQETIKNEY